jgi:hypothetical protein
MWWDVYLNGRWVNSVWYTKDCDKWWVKNGLVNHDGYPSNIRVFCVR